MPRGTEDYRKAQEEPREGHRKAEYKAFVESAKESPVPEIGLAERLAQIEVKPLLSYVGIKPPPKTPMEVLKPKETVQPFAGFAGVIAPAEAAVYTVGRLVGLETPRPPPTLISFQPGEAVEYGPEYAAGTVMGDILLSMGISKGISKVWQYVPKIVKAPIEKAGEIAAKPFKPITERIAPKIEKMILWPHEKIAPGIVSIPSPERVGMAGLEAQFTAWEMAEAPKTSALLISKMPGELTAKAWVGEHLVKSVMGGISYATVKMELQKVSVPKMPYVPKEPLVTKVADVSILAGVATVGGLKAITEPVKAITEPVKAITEPVPHEETFMVQRLRTGLIEKPTRKEQQIPLVMPKLYREPHELHKLKLYPKLYPTQKEKQTLVSVPKLGLRQASIQKQALKLVMREPTLKRQVHTFARFPSIPIFREPSLKRMQKGLWGKWFKRTHMVAPPKHVAKQLGFRLGGKRKSKR